MAISFNGGRSKQLVSFIACGCESSAPFFVIYKSGREPAPVKTPKIKSINLIH
jgi:hypothetical protein